MPMYGIYNPYNTADIGKVAPTRVFHAANLAGVKVFFDEAEAQLRKHGMGTLADKFSAEVNMKGVVEFTPDNRDHAIWVVQSIATGKFRDVNGFKAKADKYEANQSNVTRNPTDFDVVTDKASEPTTTKVNPITDTLFFVYTTDIKNGPSFALKGPSAEYINNNIKDLIPSDLLKDVELDKTRKVNGTDLKDVLMLNVLSRVGSCFDMTKDAQGNSRLH